MLRVFENMTSLYEKFIDGRTERNAVKYLARYDYNSGHVISD